MSKGGASRVALVTGASRNIGRAIALALAEEGCDIVVHVGQDIAAGQETAKAVEAVGVRATVVAGDLSVPEAAVRVVNEAAQAFGRLDVVVNNAAIRPEAPFAELSFEEWRRVLGICLDSAFLVSQAALPHLKNSDAGAIVNIGGLTAFTGAAHRVHVVTAKAGLVGLTKAMAHELAVDDITVNCVAPGLVETIREGGAAKSPHHHATRTNLLGRRGQPEEIASAVAYLCGKGGRFITGETMHVNGGAHLS